MKFEFKLLVVISNLNIWKRFLKLNSNLKIVSHEQ